MTHNPNLIDDNIARPYEHFLLEELQRLDTVTPEQQYEFDVSQHIVYHLDRHCDHETGLSDDELIAKYNGRLTEQECEWIRSHQSEYAHCTNGEWRWFKPMDSLHALWGAQGRQAYCQHFGQPLEPKWQRILDQGKASPETTRTNTYNPRPGRCVVLAEPKLDIDEHQQLADTVQRLWALLYEVRQHYRSNQPAYKGIRAAIESFKFLCARMAAEVNDIFDEPEGSETLYSKVEPNPPKRTRDKLDVRLPIDMHRRLAHELRHSNGRSRERPSGIRSRH
jgi:hypothetical protein